MLQKAAKGLSYLLIVKVLSKVLDFGLGVLITRKIQEDVLGLTTHLNLLFNFCLFYVRLCLKMTYLKRDISFDENEKITPERQKEILLESSKNLMTFGVHITSAISTGLYFFWLYQYGQLEQNFGIATALFCISAVFTSVHNVQIVKALLNFEYDVAAKAEGIGITTKNIVFFLGVYFDVFPQITCYGIANLFYGIALVFSTEILIKKNSVGSLTSCLIPKPITQKEGDKSYYIQKSMLKTTQDMTVLSILKFVLTELEKIIVVNIGTSLRAAAQYQLISNLGSIIPRHLYAPVEEVCYNLFAHQNKEQDQDDTDKQKAVGERELNILGKIVKVINLLGMLLIVFGFAYSQSILSILYKDKYDDSQTVWGMQVYWVYVYIMGLNGIAEAFFFSTANSSSLTKYRAFMGVNTAIYILISYLMADQGTVGILVSNSITMILRTFVCFLYLRERLEDKSKIGHFIFSTLPAIPVIIVGLLTAVLTQVFIPFRNPFLRIIEGGVYGLVNLGIIYKYHKQDILQVMKEKKKED